MPLFVCSICHCVDNTALGNYWPDTNGFNEAKEKRPPKCCLCDPAIGEWHGKFERLDYLEWLKRFPNTDELLNRPDRRKGARRVLGLPHRAGLFGALATMDTIASPAAAAPDLRRDPQVAEDLARERRRELAAENPPHQGEREKARRRRQRERLEAKAAKRAAAGMATELAELYRRVPTLACQGKCAESCGPIVVADAEHRAMVRAGGLFMLVLPADTTGLAQMEASTCGYLKDGRCTVYAQRPLLCRLWGTTEPMVCPFGCQPSRMLSEDEGRALLAQLRRVGGDWVAPGVGPDDPRLDVAEFTRIFRAPKEGT